MKHRQQLLKAIYILNGGAVGVIPGATVGAVIAVALILNYRSGIYFQPWLMGQSDALANLTALIIGFCSLLGIIIGGIYGARQYDRQSSIAH